MSNFESVRCDNCGKAESKWPPIGRQEVVIPVGWMSTTYSIPKTDPTGTLYPAHIQRVDFCSRDCRDIWEAANLQPRGGANHD